MKTKSILLVLAVQFGLAGAVFGQEKVIEESPGYLDFKNISELFDEEPTLEINLSGILLSMATSAVHFSDEEVDPGVTDLLENLLLVQVERYAVKPSIFDKVLGKNKEIASFLKKHKWQRIVRVREDDEDVHVFVKSRKEKIVGIVVLVLSNNDEAIFVNVVGRFSPKSLARIGTKYEFNAFEDVDGKTKQKVRKQIKENLKSNQ